VVDMKTEGISSSPLIMRTEMLFDSFGENFHPILHCSDTNVVVLRNMFTA